MRNYKLHFIRHGITQGNKEGRYVGRLDVPVCEEGLEEIKRLDNEMDYPYADVIYTSPLQRCLQTADIIYPDRDKIIKEGLIELDFGEFEGKRYAELNEDPRFVNWLGNSLENSPPCGESGVDFLNRVIESIDSIFTDMMENGHYSAVIFTHGGVIMNLFAAVGLPKHSITEWITENGKGYTVLMNPQMWLRDGCFEVYDIVPKPKRDDED